MAVSTRAKVIGAGLLFGAVAAAGIAFATQSGIEQAPARAVEISAQRILWNPEDWDEKRTGKLRFVTGLELTSEDTAFGGLSGLRIAPTGEMLAVTDQGQWLSGTLTQDTDGKVTGIESARMAPVLDAHGLPISDKFEADAESLAVTALPPLSATAFVGFEHAHRVESYDLGAEGLTASATPLLPPLPTEGLEENGSVEALALLPGAKQRLLVLMESSENDAGDHLAYLIADGRLEELSVAADPPFAITDAAFTPAGDLILVERRYSPAAGVGLKIKRIEGAGIKPGARLDGEVLLEVGNRYAIDNMEGVSAVEGENGETLLYLISDDNFNPLQRTLLLQFALDD